VSVCFEIVRAFGAAVLATCVVLVSATAAWAADVTPPVTTDDVPEAYRTSTVTVTLSAADEAGGSGVAHTYYTVGASPATPTTLSTTYDPLTKPVLTNGQRISYFSVDAAGNAETVKTSRAVVVGAATSSYSSAIAGTTGTGPQSVAVADVTGDGRPDIVTANMNADNVTVIARNGAGTGWETRAIAGSTGSVPYSVAVADVTGDGQPDIVTANYSGNNATVIARNGAGTGWDAPTSAGATGTTPRSVAVGDVTGDGRLDIVTANSASNDVTVIARNSAGTGWDSPAIAGTTGSNPRGLAISDVTGDGRPDIVTANFLGGNLSVIARNGAGTGWDASAIAGSTGSGPSSLVARDVTGDGRPDLVTSNTGADNVTVLPRNGTGTGWSSTVVVGPVASIPLALAVTDVTGDGRPDIITASGTGNTVSILPRNNTGTAWNASAVVGSTGTNPFALAVRDVNGDGHPDLVTANNGGGNVSVLTANFDGTAPVTTDDVDVAWRPHVGSIPVTLSATDAGGSGVSKTYYMTGVSPATPTTSSAVYNASAKPTLNEGERISYFSVDVAGNAETVKTSGAALSVGHSVILPATGVSATGATLHAAVASSVPEAQFLYRKAGVSTWIAAPKQAVAPGGAVDATVSGLDAATVYYAKLRLYPLVDGQYEYSATTSFTTAADGLNAGDVVVSPAADVTTTGATLSATVDTHGSPVSGVVEWGTAAGDYTRSSALYASGPSGARVLSRSLPTQFAPGTTYHYRFTVTNAGGTFTTADQTFTTAGAAAPDVTIGAVNPLMATTAQINVVVDAHGAAVTSTLVELGTTTDYTKAPAPLLSGELVSGGRAYTRPFNNLKTGVTYHYKVTVTTTAGTYESTDQTFTTAGRG